MKIKNQTLQVVSFVFSQISILFFGGLLGCWVTVATRSAELASGDRTIQLIRDLGIVFTVFFIISCVVSIVAYFLSKKKVVHLDQTKTTDNEQNKVVKPVIKNAVKPNLLNVNGNANVANNPNSNIINKTVTVKEVKKTITPINTVSNNVQSPTIKTSENLVKSQTVNTVATPTLNTNVTKTTTTTSIIDAKPATNNQSSLQPRPQVVANKPTVPSNQGISNRPTTLSPSVNKPIQQPSLNKTVVTNTTKSTTTTTNVPRPNNPTLNASRVGSTSNPNMVRTNPNMMQKPNNQK